MNQITKEEALKKAIQELKPEDEQHFINGWKMYPDYWSTSTESWKMGFKAKEKLEKGTV